MDRGDADAGCRPATAHRIAPSVPDPWTDVEEALPRRVVRSAPAPEPADDGAEATTGRVVRTPDPDGLSRRGRVRPDPLTSDLAPTVRVRRSPVDARPIVPVDARPIVTDTPADPGTRTERLWRGEGRVRPVPTELAVLHARHLRDEPVAVQAVSVLARHDPDALRALLAVSTDERNRAERAASSGTDDVAFRHARAWARVVVSLQDAERYLVRMAAPAPAPVRGVHQPDLFADPDQPSLFDPPL